MCQMKEEDEIPGKKYEQNEIKPSTIGKVQNTVYKMLNELRTQ